MNWSCMSNVYHQYIHKNLAHVIPITLTAHSILLYEGTTFVCKELLIKTFFMSTRSFFLRGTD